MAKFKLVCPGCGAVIITSLPTAVIWELCPSCHLHIWDKYDALMADIVPDDAHGVRVRNNQISS